MAFVGAVPIFFVEISEFDKIFLQRSCPDIIPSFFKLLDPQCYVEKVLEHGNIRSQQRILWRYLDYRAITEIAGHGFFTERERSDQSFFTISHPDINAVITLSSLAGKHDSASSISDFAYTESGKIDDRSERIGRRSCKHSVKDFFAGSADMSFAVQDHFFLEARFVIEYLTAFRRIICCHGKASFFAAGKIESACKASYSYDHTKQRNNLFHKRIDYIVNFIYFVSLLKSPFVSLFIKEGSSLLPPLLKEVVR